jgi:hypothetical protein
MGSMTKYNEITWHIGTPFVIDILSLSGGEGIKSSHLQLRMIT